jgi:methyltransferase
VSSDALFLLLISATAFERLAELALSRRNAAWSFARGGKEYGRGHYPLMVALHVGLLVGAPAEVLLLARPFLPVLGWPMLSLTLAAHALRWTAVGTLGAHWTTRVIVLPGHERIRSGPYRFIRHPNYLAVVVEGFALPLVHSAWITATLFTSANLPLMAVRIRCEERALLGATAA